MRTLLFLVAEENKTDATSSKESPIPAELNAVVEALKNLIKEEKSLSSEISHTTDKQIKQVKDDTEALSQLVTGLGSTLQNNRSATIIKFSTVQILECLLQFMFIFCYHSFFSFTIFVGNIFGEE